MFVFEKGMILEWMKHASLFLVIKWSEILAAKQSEKGYLFFIFELYWQNFFDVVNT